VSDSRAWRAEAVGVEPIRARMERLRAERDAIEAELEANERDQVRLVERWNGNVREWNRLARKLRLHVGEDEA
jgi:hypothetical protein